VPKPDLVAFRVLHRALRADAGRLCQAICQVHEPERVERAQQLSRWYGAFLAEVNGHHTFEDESFLAALHRRVPLVDHHIGRIETDHACLDAALDRTQRGLERLGDLAVPFSNACRRAAQSAADLHQLLARHLDFEETFVLPLLEREAPRVDYVDFDWRHHGDRGAARRSFTIPWAMDHARPDESQSLLGAAPPAFRWLWIATRRHYRRMVVEAFGPDS
jgi:hemerythrin-like domain-containing protein